MSNATEAVAQNPRRPFVERIERPEEETKRISDDIRDVRSEANGAGF